MFSYIFDRAYDRSFGFGITLYWHKHMNNFPNHLHILVCFAYWFLEVQILDDVPK
jgi:hypothetical protein